MESSRKAWGEVLLIFVVVVLAYLPSLWNGFVYDDENYVVSNPLTHGKLNLRQIFTDTYPPGAKDQGLYRPLVTLSYYLDGKVWGFARPGESNGFHFTNLFFHALNTCLLWILLRQLGMRARPRLVASIIFGIHPALTEAVAWIVGRAELLGMSFGLLAILSFLWRPRGIGLMVGCFLWVCATLCKEHWLALPALVAWIFVCMPTTPKLEKALIVWSGCLAVFIASSFLVVRAMMVGSWHPPVSAYGSIPIFSRTATALRVLWQYIGLWIWPVSLSVHHEVFLVTKISHGVMLWGSWFFVFWLMWRARRFFPWFTLALGWYWIAMLPVSNLIIPIGAISGERFMYLGTLFFAPVMVVGVNKAFSVVFQDSVRKPLAILLAVMGCLLLLGRLWIRLDDWKGDLSLWRSAARCYPQSYAIKAQLSMALLRGGEFAAAHVMAAEALNQSVQSPQPYQKHFNPHLVHVDVLAQTGMRQMVWHKKFAAANDAARNLRPQEALESYHARIEEFPEQPQTHEALGDLYVRLNNAMAARQHFEEAIRLGACSSELFAKYGQSLSELGNKAEALLMYDRSLKINPLDPIVHYNRGVVLGELGDGASALSAFKMANRLLPKLAAPHLNAAAILIHLKCYNEARAELVQVFALDPKQPEALSLLQKIPNVGNQKADGENH